MPDFREERDALVPPQKGYVYVESEDYPEGYNLKLPRLTMRRTLRISQLLDSVSEDPELQPHMQNLVNAMTTGGDSPGIAQIASINRFFAHVNPDLLTELFEVITGMNKEWLDRNLEVGWGIQAIRAAFQQQGFSRLFANVSDTATEAGDNPLQATPQTTAVQEVSAPQSISYNQHTAGTTTPY